MEMSLAINAIMRPAHIRHTATGVDSSEFKDVSTTIFMTLYHIFLMLVDHITSAFKTGRKKAESTEVFLLLRRVKTFPMRSP